MTTTPPEVVLTFTVFTIGWLILVAVSVVGARRWPRLAPWRGQLLANLRPALVISAVYAAGVLLGSGLDPGRGVGALIGGLAVFCQALVGLALAYRIRGFEPLPVVRAFLTRQHRVRQIVLAVLIALLLVLPVLIIGSMGMGLGGLFGETHRTEQAISSFPLNPVQVFFLLLAGAGIAEETTYRLVVVSLVWRLSGRVWLGILAGAFLFGAYHLSPLDSMYRVFWDYPISQFLSSALIGLVWGIVYAKRGLETAVLAHTFGDWIPYLIFTQSS